MLKFLANFGGILYIYNQIHLPLQMPVLNHIQTLRLSELSRRIADTLSNAFAYNWFWVIAEVSNHSFYHLKEHHYFELIEKEDNGIVAKMQAVAWKPGAARIKNFEAVTGQKFKNGLKVCIRVQVEFHPAFGLKLLVSDVDPSFTLGQLELQRQATLARLLDELSEHVQKSGDEYLTTNKKLQHSKVIQHIAILSSNASAGYQDFIHTLANNQFGYKFIIRNYFVAVQGEAHADKLCAKIDEIAKAEPAFDAVIIIRGGGADTDFILFDQFALCQAVARLHIPVITGIGHLKNQSLVDLLAHTSTNAPTRAAEFIIAHNRKFESALLDEQRRIVIKTQQLLQRHEQLVDRNNAVMVRNARAILAHNNEKQQLARERITNNAKKQLINRVSLLRETATKTLHRPQITLAYKKIALQNLAEEFKTIPFEYMLKQRKQLDYFDAFCRLVSPENILKRGFALVYRNNQILTSGSGITEGERIHVKLQDTDLAVTVNNKITNDGKETDL